MSNRVFDKNIYATGEYVQHFLPEERNNPFRRLYERKKKDTLGIVSSLQNSRFVLDAGGGMGRVSLALAQSSTSRIVLMDISGDMLRLAFKSASGLHNLHCINSDAHELPFADKSFDCIVGLDLFCHLGEPEKALREFHRVLADGGILILDSTNSNPVWALFFPRYMGKNPLNWFRIFRFGGVFPGWQSIVRHYSGTEFFSMLGRTGFTVTRRINYGPKVCPKWHLAVSQKNGSLS